MNNILILLITIIPALLICLFTYLLDKNKETPRLIFKLFLTGVLSVIVAFIITYVISFFNPLASTSIEDLSNYNFMEKLLYIIFFIGLIEEGSKWFFAYRVGAKGEEFDQPFDAVVYAVLVSLGFALFENVIYVLYYSSSIALIRAFTAIPAHFACALFMGYFMGMAKLREDRDFSGRKQIILSIIIPIIIHSLYDLIALSVNSILWVFMYLIFIMAFGIILTIILRRYPNFTKYEKKQYCLRCGSKLTNNICSKCGNIK